MVDEFVGKAGDKSWLSTNDTGCLRVSRRRCSSSPQSCEREIANIGEYLGEECTNRQASLSLLDFF
jgi:hypothetical protein